MKRSAVVFGFCALFGSSPLQAQQVTSDRILRASSEPENWLTYNGTYNSQRHSTLTQITPANVTNLESKWVLQNQVFGAWQSNPIVVDGIMYVTQRPNDVMAVDARTGRVFWQYRYTPAPEARVCCGANNRGVAILGDTLFMGTLDAHLVAIDAKNGRPLWNVVVADVKLAYSITMAPLIVKDKVIVGVGGGEFGIRGFIAAYDAKPEKKRGASTRFQDPASLTRYLGRRRLEEWRRLGVGHRIVRSGTQSHLLGHRQPGARLEPDQRPGDNLPDSGGRSTPTLARLGGISSSRRTTCDYDSVQGAVLADMNWQGRRRR